MRAIILAAGRGSRLNELTDNRPKALTVLNDKTLIEWQIQALKEAGIPQIAIVTGYLGEQLNSYGTYHFNNPYWETTNMLSSLWTAKKWLLEDICIISYGDIIYRTKIVKDLISVEEEVAIAYDPNWLKLWSQRFSDPLVDAETFSLDDNAYVTTIGESSKSLREIEGQYMGLLKFAPSFWKKEKFPEADWDKLSMTDFLRKRINEGCFVKAVENTEAWAEVDSQKDLEVAAEIWGKAQRDEGGEFGIKTSA